MVRRGMRRRRWLFHAAGACRRAAASCHTRTPGRSPRTANQAPLVAQPNLVFLTRPGEHINYDPAKGGATFTDPDGDQLLYSTTALESPSGLTVVGGRVVGSLAEARLATFEVTASDGFGGTVVDKCGIAAVGPEPGGPVLPSSRYTYADSELALP